MRYYQIAVGDELRLAVETAADVLADLTAISSRVRTVFDLLHAASLSGTAVDVIAEDLVDRGAAVTYSLEDVVECSQNGRTGPSLALPLASPEVWAAGVTYRDSLRERQSESDTPDVYAKVYQADRPELFFKATPSRLAGPYEEVGVRADSEWNVPEPELAFLLYEGKIAGYTVGNDMSSRSIEGANPLYLPQAKLYDRSAAIGPCFVTPETVGDPQDLEVTLTIGRAGQEMFRQSASTSQMKRTCAELADWMQRHNPVPDGTAVLTGTSIIPPEEFTLREGDIISIEIERIGTLVNTAVVV